MAEADELSVGWRRDANHIYIELETAAPEKLPDALELRPARSEEYSKDGITLAPQKDSSLRSK